MRGLKKLPRAKEGLWLTKDNELIKMHSNMTAGSYKITNYMLWKATRMSDMSQPFTMTASEIVSSCNIKNHNYSAVLDEETSKIMNTWIEIRKPNKEEYVKISMMDRLEYHKGGILEAQLSPSMVSLIGNLKKEFTQNNYVQVNKCKTYAAMRLYEVCNSWIRTGYAYYSLDKWRKLMGGTQKTFDTFTLFKKRFFVPAVNCVNKKTDLQIEPEFIKTGRKVTHIKVTILKKEDTVASQEIPTLIPAPEETPIMQPELPIEEGFSLEERDAIRKMVTVYKQRPECAESYIQNYGLEYCKQQMEYVRQENKQKKIDKIGGYFYKAVCNDYAGTKQAQIKAAQAEESERKEIVDWDKQIMKQGSLFPEDEDLVQKILGEHPEVADMYRSMKMPDEKIARWLEQYSETLLLKKGFRLQKESSITAEYVEAVLMETKNKS